ncbi:UDP-glucuronosyl/UDP-glucosyltransferase [Artemisia annua]|uniref:UDP-glucuronosyl/UDP-glucosyltransferase n=1 Tax=Artemisia annua TaxID=35608 RepID=A0A2U1P680_ARTAN|nr:UDP-glucuronosyl/UDP-glucosyltransferase [Artemisia annua]
MVNAAANLIFIPAPRVGHIMSLGVSMDTATVEITNLLVNRDKHLSITVLIINPSSLDSGSASTTYIESLAIKSIDRVYFIEIPQDKTPPPIEGLKLSSTASKGFISAVTGSLQICEKHCV